MGQRGYYNSAWTAHTKGAPLAIAGTGTGRKLSKATSAASNYQLPETDIVHSNLRSYPSVPLRLMWSMRK